jgi:hypothetical protein
LVLTVLLIDEEYRLLRTRLDSTFEWLGITRLPDSFRTCTGDSLNRGKNQPDDPRCVFMNWRYFHPILRRFEDVEYRERRGNDGVQGGFCKIHAGANPSPISEADVTGIALSWPLGRGDMPIGIEGEWIGIGLWIVKHVPIEVSQYDRVGSEWRYQRLAMMIEPFGIWYP